jgi:hypothetical protein
MNRLSGRTYITLFIALFIALVLPATLSVWRLAVPGVMSTSTYAALTALLIGVAVVTLNSARNAGPTGSLGQMLYETEHPARASRGDNGRSNPW